MKNRILSLLTVMLVAMILTSTVSAGGNVGFLRLSFKSTTSSGTSGLATTMATTSESFKDSLLATATMTGLGGYRQGVTVRFAASGDPKVICTNQGGNEAPGQNPSNVTADGNQFVGPQDITKKGTAPMDVKATPKPLTGTEGGCPNDLWTAKIVSVEWTNAELLVIDTATEKELLHRKYTCDPEKQTDTDVFCIATTQ